MDWLMDPQSWIALVTLVALEVVLGIDNIIFISILAGKLPASQQARARLLGLGAAMISRILLLLSLAWIIRLTRPLFSVFGNDISGRDLILIIGGLFLLAKSTHEIHQKMEGEESHANAGRVSSFRGVIFMMFSSGPVSAFVDRRPTVKILALSFLLLIGFTLILDGFNQHIPKGYIYSAMAFSVFVEMLNLRIRKVQSPPVRLHDAYKGKLASAEKE